MTLPATRWVIRNPDLPRSADDVLAALLANRGLDRASLACRPEELEAASRSIRNLDAAAGRTARAVQEGERIVLVGDYDCDGLTSVAQLAGFLRALGFRDFAALTPASRADGYGMPLDAARKHPDARLFIVFDSGTFDVAAVEAARARGADVIVIDHHEISDAASLAPATHLVNPRHPDCPSPFKDFATAGLTLLFLDRLGLALPERGMRAGPDEDALALAAVGTLADMMPLRGANRAIVALGLEALNRGRQPALQALRAVAGLAGRRLTPGHIGFQIAPRLNAAARVAEARIALDLLLAEEPNEIDRLANQLDQLNRRRQQQVEQLVDRLAAESLDPGERRTLVFSGRDYPLGLNGILAQRVARDFHRPAFFLQLFEEQGLAVGSGRSIPGFDLHAALGECADLLERWGGHAQAAGVTVRAANLEAFGVRLEAVAQGLPPALFERVERADLELPPELVTPELVRALAQLEPHGIGNPAPRFVMRGQRLRSTRAFGAAGRRDHLEVGLPGGLRGVYWGGAGIAGLSAGATVDLVCGLSWDDYRGAPQLDIKDAGALCLETAPGNGVTAAAAE